RLARKGLAHRVKRTRLEVIVGIEPGEDLAAGARETFADGGGLSAVRGAARESEPRRVPADDLRAAVGRASVQDQVFERGIVLVEHGTDGPLEIGSLVV